jgi:hypothetical protein
MVRLLTDTSVPLSVSQSRNSDMTFVRGITCTFVVGEETRFYSQAVTPYTAGWFLALNCPMPEGLERVLMTANHDTLELNMMWSLGLDTSFEDSVTLFPQRLEPVKGVSPQLCDLYLRLI